MNKLPDQATIVHNRPTDAINQIITISNDREKFYTDTRDLRKQIDQKQMALSREMDKVNPDQGKIFELQKEISSLRSDFDQKAIAHQMEIRRLLPDNYRGSGYGRGYCW